MERDARAKRRATLACLAFALVACTAAEVEVASSASVSSGGPPASVPSSDEPPFCGPFETLCGPNCVATETDARHCGACGFACARTASCVRGRCLDGVPAPAIDPTLPSRTTRCRADEAACGDACVSLHGDPSNCGACGVVCDGACHAGRCEGGV